MFPPTLLSCSSRFLRALQQNRAQSRLLYLLIRAIFPNVPDVDRKIQLHKALCVPYGNSGFPSIQVSLNYFIVCINIQLSRYVLNELVSMKEELADHTCPGARLEPSSLGENVLHFKKLFKILLNFIIFIIFPWKLSAIMPQKKWIYRSRKIMRVFRPFEGNIGTKSYNLYSG